MSDSRIPKAPVSVICARLQELQRERSIIIKTRIMVSNRMQAIVAGTIGYQASMKETERAKVFAEATKLIEAVVGGKTEHKLANIIKVTDDSIRSLDKLQAETEKKMLALVRQLPVAAWAQETEQCGFGLKSLAIIIGETGDLNNYANPSKVWRRLGCAPWSFDGQTLMGATWRGGKLGKLPAVEWSEYGYSPRRRSIAYLIGEGLMKQNWKKDTWVGPYRARYEEARKRFDELHPECKEEGSKKRSQLHGMLLATKLLLKNLWVEWRK